MSGAVYLLALLAGIGAMLAIDRRFRLFFWHNARAAALVSIVSVLVLLVADGVGIAFGLFLRGDSPIATGIVLAPHLPIEEPVFLAFLVLNTAVLYTGTARLLERRGREVVR